MSDTHDDDTPPQPLRALEAAGIGEGDFGESPEVPADAVYAYECMEAAGLGVPAEFGQA